MHRSAIDGISGRSGNTRKRGINVRFFEINDPMYALIAAENTEECIDFYAEVVCSVEDKEKFLASIKELNMSDAITELSNTVSEATARTLVSSCVFHGEGLVLLAVEEEAE
ncbi:hypothetical protein AL523_01870 [Enterococcus gallinarum]|nr:hypothetical protein AL523_01870 [Enterococcus gallinarum]